ncbi:MAG: DEAD/DEAH box helicase [Rikenellaceae bacterium]
MELFISSTDSHTLSVLKFIAYCLKPPILGSIKSFSKSIGKSAQETENVINKLVSKRIVIRVENYYNNYSTNYLFICINAQAHTILLKMLAKDDDVEVYAKYEKYFKESFSSMDFSENITRINRAVILNFLKFNTTEKLHNDASNFCRIDYKKFNYLTHLSSYWIKQPELKPLIELLPEDCKTELINSMYISVSDDLDYESLEILNNLSESKNTYFLAIYRDILSGNFSLISECKTVNSTNFVALTIMYTLQGRFETAIEVFESGLKLKNRENKRRDKYSNICICDFMYLISLINCGIEVNKNKITKFCTLSSKSQFYDEYEFLVMFGQCIYDEKYIDSYFKYNYHLSKTVVKRLIFTSILSNYSTGETKTELEGFLVGINLSKFPALYALYPKELLNKLEINLPEGVVSIFPTIVRLEEWEKALNNIIVSKKSETEVNNTDSSKKKGRVVYCVEANCHITPKLQTSKDGGKRWTKGRNIALSTFKDGIEEMSALDKSIAKLVKTIQTDRYYGFSEKYSLNGIAVLRLLVGHPNLYTERYRDTTLIPLDIKEEKAYLSVRKDKNGFHISTNINFKNRYSIDERIRWHGETHITIVNTNYSNIALIKKLWEIKTFPLTAAEKLKEVLTLLSSEIDIQSNLLVQNNNVKVIESNSNLTVQLIPKADGFRGEIFVKPFKNSTPYCKAGDGNENIMGNIDGELTQTTRNLKLEKKNIVTLNNELISFNHDENWVYLLEGALECLSFLEKLHPLEYVDIEWPEGVAFKLKRKVDFNNFNISIKHNRNWFEVVGSVTFDDKEIQLSEIIEQISVSGNDKFINIGDNEYITLSGELKRAVKSIESLSTKGKKGEYKISEFAIGLIKDIKDSDANFKADKHFNALVKKIEQSQDKVYTIPKQLQASLRSYQEEGFGFMSRLADWGSGACLADDMGLGKTVQTIAMLLSRAKLGASLIIVPASLIHNWKSEILRFAPSLTSKILHGNADRKELVASAEEFDVIITTYGMLVSESEILIEKNWNMIVLDEAHTIKNKETKMSKAAMELQGNFKLLLTGTPIQNHLGEIWNLFQFMNPGLLGTIEEFSSRYIYPIEQANDAEKRQSLKNLISPFLLRRTKSEVLGQLPLKTEIVLPVEMSNKEAIFYEKIRRKAQASVESGELNQIQTLAEITRLRQAASHIGLADKNFKEKSSKIEAFLKLFEQIESNNHRALVFSQFTSHLALVREELDKQGIEYLYLDGSTSISEREKLVKKFQKGGQPLFLISLKAGGLGLNLTAADYVVHLDPWWNPAIENQASDRAHRIGQTRPVTVYRLISSNTIEEKIIELHKSKKDLADSLLEGTNLSHKLTKNELLELISKK